MRRVPVLSFALTILSTASAFKLPANLTDGVYGARWTKEGQELFLPIMSARQHRHGASDIVTSKERAQALKKREFEWGHTHCGCDNPVDVTSTDLAVAELKKQFIGGVAYIAPLQAWYSVSGSTVAFLCNEDGNSNLKMYDTDITNAALTITNSCGFYRAGSVGGNFDISIGYMNYQAGLDFCGNALSSPAEFC